MYSTLNCRHVFKNITPSVPLTLFKFIEKNLNDVNNLMERTQYDFFFLLLTEIKPGLFVKTKLPIYFNFRCTLALAKCTCISFICLVINIFLYLMINMHDKKTKQSYSQQPATWVQRSK